MKKYMLCIFPIVSCLIVLCLIFATVVFSASGSEESGRVEKWDKKNLRYTTGVITDCSYMNSACYIIKLCQTNIKRS